MKNSSEVYRNTLKIQQHTLEETYHHFHPILLVTRLILLHVSNYTQCFEVVNIRRLGSFWRLAASGIFQRWLSGRHLMVNWYTGCLKWDSQVRLGRKVVVRLWKFDLYVAEIKLTLSNINCKRNSTAAMRLQIILDKTLSKGLNFGSKARRYMVFLCPKVSNWLGSLLYVCWCW